MSNQKFNYESLQDAVSIRTYLESLIDSIEKGSINLKCDGEEISMRVGDIMKFSVKAKQKDGLNKLNLKISWAENDRRGMTNNKPITIASDIN